MKKIKILLDGIKASKWFMMGVFVEIILCIVLMSIANTQYIHSMGMLNFYDNSMADNCVVRFNKYRTYQEAQENYDMSEMALVGEIAMVEFDREQILIATPTLVKQFKQMGIHFSNSQPQEYMEAYAKQKYIKTYLKGNIYDIVTQDYDESGKNIVLKVKILGHLKEEVGYYGTNVELTKNFALLLCGMPPLGARIDTGIAFNEKGVEHYGKDGNNTWTAEEFYQMNMPSGDSFFKQLSIVAVLLTILSIFSCYMLSVNKQKRRYAIYYACGERYSNLVILEILKMAVVFAVSFMVAFFMTLGIKDLRAFSNLGLISWMEFLKASGIVLAVYIASLVIGIASIASVKPLKVLANNTAE